MNFKSVELNENKMACDYLFSPGFYHPFFTWSQEGPAAYPLDSKEPSIQLPNIPANVPIDPYSDPLVTLAEAAADYVLFCGGFHPVSEAHDECWTLDLVAGAEWRLVAARLAIPRRNHSSAVMDGKLWVIGRVDSSGER